MKYKKNENMPKLKSGTFFVKFDFETIEECIGSYCTVENSPEGEVFVGLPSIEAALNAGRSSYKSDPDGIPDFEILDSDLNVVKTVQS